MVRELDARVPNGAFVWAVEPALAPPWRALRGMLAQAREVVGQELTMRAMRPHAGLLSLCLRGLDAELASSARRVRDKAGGLRVATVPGVVSRPRALTRAFAETVVALLNGRCHVIAIPDARRLDLESLRAIRPLLARAQGRAGIEVQIGYDPMRPQPSDPLDALRHALVEREMQRIEAMSITTVATATKRESDAASPESASMHPLDDDLEGRALRALAAGERPDAEMLLAALRVAFDAYGFEAALRLGRVLAERAVDEETRREAIALAALSCHNLAPLARGTDWPVAFMRDHFTAALEGERDERRRSHWLYRLGMLEARACGRTAAALVLGGGAVAAAIAARDGHAEAWARNGRAYALMRARQLEQAARDCEDGLAALARDTTAPEPCVAVTRVLLANNRAKLAGAMGDGEALCHWRDVTQRHLAVIPADERPSHVWLAPPEDLADLRPTLQHHRACLEQARADLDPEAEAVALHHLALCEYRLGEAARAADGFRRALELFRVIGADPGDIATEELNLSVSAFRAGDFDGAERGFAALQNNELFSAPGSQAELLGARAMIAAARCDGAEHALEHAREALALAEAADDPDALGRVLRSIGEALLALGKRSDAAAPLERALALADAHDATAEDLLGVLVAWLEAGSPDAQVAGRALALVPRALSDPNAWWELPRLLRALASLVESRSLDRGDPHLARAIAAASQRRDCQAAMNVLHSIPK
jgi:tetratricopeptide (TPR) repeat protein